MGESIKKQLTTGIFFTAIAKYSNMVIALIVTAILSRILSPQEFGYVAIATVIIAFFGMFTEIGIAPAIIQNKDLDDNDYSSIFSFTIWSGLLLSLLFIACALPIANFYKSFSLFFLTGQFLEHVPQLHSPFDDFLIFLYIIYIAPKRIGIVINISISSPSLKKINFQY